MSVFMLGGCPIMRPPHVDAKTKTCGPVQSDTMTDLDSPTQIEYIYSNLCRGVDKRLGVAPDPIGPSEVARYGQESLGNAAH
jgi:hypothetical protein